MRWKCRHCGSYSVLTVQGSQETRSQSIRRRIIEITERKPMRPGELAERIGASEWTIRSHAKAASDLHEFDGQVYYGDAASGGHDWRTWAL